MSPTVLRHGGYRFFFFSREENRLHVHVSCANGEAKFWLTPNISVAGNSGLSSQQLNEIMGILQERQNDFVQAWRKHFRH
jgi:hypothetical protein